MPAHKTHVLVACALFAPTSSAIAEFISASLIRNLNIDASLREVTNTAARTYASILARAASAGETGSDHDKSLNLCGMTPNARVPDPLAAGF